MAAKITAITVQARNIDRVNVSIDGKYCFSLDLFQVTELGVKIGNEYSKEELSSLEQESQFGKLYLKALDYCLMRLHSAKEVRNYLKRQTYTKRYKSRKSGEIKERPGASQELVKRVFDRLIVKGYIDDVKFTRFWLENRQLTKGISSRKLTAELRSKGIDQIIIEEGLAGLDRNDQDELKKIIAKKARRYPDEQKLIAYLARQGFSYDDIRRSLDVRE